MICHCSLPLTTNFPPTESLCCYTHYSAAVESTGQTKAEAQSRAEAAKIEGEAAVEQAKLKAEASKIEAVSSHYSTAIRSGYILAGCFI